MSNVAADPERTEPVPRGGREPSDTELLEIGAETLRVEAEGIGRVRARLGPEFVEAVRRILATEGRVVVTGVGKSGLVARKIASTLASTGTPALFLHPTEAVHGDVGVLVRGDVLLVVSKSGASGELEALLPAVRTVDVPVIAITGSRLSPLGRAAGIVLDASVPEEACPHDVSPTASSTAAVALGDALAMALLVARGLDADDYARLHPGGAIGRRLLWTVRDVMVTGGEGAPRVSPDAPLSETMAAIAHRRGTVAVVEDDGRLVGVVTAGDLTRFADTDPGFMDRPTSAAMNPEPRTTSPGERASRALEAMERHGIMALPVLEDDRLVGMIHLHDVLRAGVGGERDA